MGMVMNAIIAGLREHRRMVACIAIAMLIFCCVGPRRTESYFRTNLPGHGDRPVNNASTDLPVPKNVESFVNCIGMRMIRVPAGDFVMGSPADERGRNPDEAQRGIRIPKPFAISQTEVTQSEWNAVMEFNPSQFVGDRLPVQNVRMSDAWVFCDRLTKIDGRKYMPPTELEWEYACRAGTLTPYNTGTALMPSQARFAVRWRPGSENNLGPLPVGSYPPNDWGLYDMHGNVAECCGDTYSPGNLIDRIAGYADPYLIFKDDAVFRGGSWESPAVECRSANRAHAHRFDVQDTVGFRVIIVEK
jgi:formylglycine-generating enzyme required for sulfatase activity